MQKKFRQIADDMIKSALHAVDPYNLIMEQLEFHDNTLIIQNKSNFNLDQYENIFVIGAGKGTAPMASAMEKVLGSKLKAGCISVKYGHGLDLEKIRVLEAGHPIPDSNTLENTKQILNIVDQAEENDLVFVLLTGGGSALFESLPDAISLDDLAKMNQLLLSSGATIDEINTIRKHISLIKGGRVADRIAPATAVSLILSDVIGDPLESIASGPTAPDPTTFDDSIHVIEKFGLEDKIPGVILDHLHKGQKKIVAETPKTGDAIFNKVHNFVIGNNALALKQLAKIAESNGFKPFILTDRAQGEAREIARLIAGIVKSSLRSGLPVNSPGCIILGGEPTVTLRGSGKGGRNQELVLAVLNELNGTRDPFYFCSIGSDGTDGPTDAAGAWIDDSTIAKVKERELNPSSFLQDNNAYNFFTKINQLILTGPTRTNVMDFVFCLF
jgi:glycerate 2-kinase